MENTPSQANEKTPVAQPVNGTEKPKRERRPKKPKTEEGQAPKEDGAEPKPKRERPPKKDKDTPAQNGDKKPKDGDKKPKDGEKKPNAPQYRKKGEGDQQPKKSSSPQAEKTPAPDGEDQPEKKKRRPQTSKNPEMQYRPKGSAPEKDEEAAADTPAGEEEAPKEKKEAPKNLIYKNPMEFVEKRKFKSKWEEYRHGDWRKGSGKTFVTLETVIPETPEKLLKPPEEKAFHSKQQEIEDKIKEINTGLEEKKTQFEEILAQKQAQMKAGDTGVVFSKELSQKFVKMGDLKKERQKIYDAQEKAEAEKPQQMAIKEQNKGKIDPYFNKEEMIPKAIRDAEKTFQTASGNYKKEQEFVRRIDFLKKSIPAIQAYNAAEEKLKAMAEAKKNAGTDLPKIKNEMKKLQAEIDELKKGQDVKIETKESFDKQLDAINEKRKKMRDERDKLYKQKEELRDNYYGALIDYSKQQYLLQDIQWMTQMQDNLKVRKAEKDKRDQEYKERKERIQKEREEKERREEERKQREIARKEKEIENKKAMEEQLKNDEIEKLKKIDLAIQDNAVGSSPMFEQIEQCEQLKKYCLKQMKKDQPVTEEEKADQKSEAQKQIKSELEKALQKGSIQLAPTKEEKLAQMQTAINGNKKGKKNKNKNNNDNKDGSIDFVLIKKFNNLKINAPINETDYEKTISDLDELKDALIYWGKIIQRQNKIKFIRNARKISSIEEYTEQAEFEEKYIENEKSKFDGENVADKTNLSLDKLKIAQVIDRENRVKRAWNDEEDEEESDEEEQSEEENDSKPAKKGQADLYGDSKPTREGKGRKRRVVNDDEEEEVAAPRQTQRPNAQKFKDIMKADDAFPTLENQFEDEEDDLLDGETPAGEINSQNGEDK